MTASISNFCIPGCLLTFLNIIQHRHTTQTSKFNNFFNGSKLASFQVYQPKKLYIYAFQICPGLGLHFSYIRDNIPEMSIASYVQASHISLNCLNQPDVTLGPVHKRTNHVPKDVSERDSTLSWFESLILPFVNANLFQIRLLKREKKAFLDCDPHRRPDSRTCERKALSERDSCVCILEMRAEAMHGSISADCAVGTKYYLAVRRSCSWLGRRLQCMWTHIVQITKRIAIQNVFRNVIRSFVNTASVVILISSQSVVCWSVNVYLRMQLNVIGM